MLVIAWHDWVAGTGDHFSKLQLHKRLTYCKRMKSAMQMQWLCRIMVQFTLYKNSAHLHQPRLLMMCVWKVCVVHTHGSTARWPYASTDSLCVCSEWEWLGLTETRTEPWGAHWPALTRKLIHMPLGATEKLASLTQPPHWPPALSPGCTFLCYCLLPSNALGVIFQQRPLHKSHECLVKVCAVCSLENYLMLK